MNTIKKIFIVFCLSSLPSSLTLITLIGSLVYTDTAEASVTKMFGQANALFRAGKYPAAAKRLRVIIKKYPTFQPSYLLMGRIYYRLGNIRRAAKYFQKAPIGLLSGDAAYEYGIAMYETNRFNKAIKAFGKLSSKSKYRDLAYFYRGASYMKVSQWQRAVGQLQLAKKLPGHLTSARRKLLQTAQGRARAERQGKITRNTYVVVPRPQPLASPYYGAPDPAAPKPKNAPLPPPPPPPATAGFTNSITPSLAINSTTENNQFHGFKDSENKSSSQTLK